jgi:hypothetical protein
VLAAHSRAFYGCDKEIRLGCDLLPRVDAPILTFLRRAGKEGIFFAPV